MSSQEHRCAGRIYHHYSFSACGKKAAHEHEGAWFCKTHHPPTVKARDDARKAKWNEKFRAEQDARKVIAKAERKRAYDALLLPEAISALQQLVAQYIDASHGAFGHWNANGDECVIRAEAVIKKAGEELK